MTRLSAKGTQMVDWKKGDPTAAVISYLPGELAPVTGAYCLLNVFGTTTADSVTVMEGEPLPPCPYGFSWRLEQRSEEPGDELRRLV
jgi:hypothetical protein